MSFSSKRLYGLPVTFIAVITTAMLLSRAGPAASENIQVASIGPYSLPANGGSGNERLSSGANVGARTVTPALNVRFLGAYDTSEASYGSRLADSPAHKASRDLLHSYPTARSHPGKTEFFSTDFLNELSESLALIYEKRNLRITETTTLSLDWGRLGMVYITPEHFKAVLYYDLSEPGGDNYSSIIGEVSYPLAGGLRFGVSASGDLSNKATVERDWNGLAFVSYSFGSVQPAH